MGLENEDMVTVKVVFRFKNKKEKYTSVLSFSQPALKTVFALLIKWLLHSEVVPKNSELPMHSTIHALS